MNKKQVIALALCLSMGVGMLPLQVSAEEMVETVAVTTEESAGEVTETSGEENSDEATISEGKCGENVTWELSDEGVLTISGTGPMMDWEDVTEVPWYDPEYTLEVTSAVVEEGVTTIGNYCFEETSIEAVSLPSTLVSIGDSAFLACTELAEIDIPDNVNTIGEYAFCYCTALESLTIPANVQIIGKEAFSMCYLLKNISVEEGNQYYKAIDDVLFDKDVKQLILYAVEKEDLTYTVPESVTEICPCAFYYSEILIEVSLPEGLEKIGEYAFSRCSYLERVDIPDSVKVIEEGAFYDCTVLEEIKISNSITSIEDYVFGWCPALKSITIPEKVTKIGNGAFMYGIALTEVYFEGDAPEFIEDSLDNEMYCFYEVTANAYYEENNATWTEDVMQDYGGKLTWIPYEAETDENPFVDISESDYYYDAVLWAYENGITTGKDDTHFLPTGACTRAQVVTFLWRANGEPEPKTTENPFTDVNTSDYYYKAVLWAYENGITNGKTATEFQPEVVVNRSQFVTFLWRAEGEPAVTIDNSFEDVSAGQYYTDAVLWAYDNGITQGKDATHFQPFANCQRCQVVTFLYRAEN